MKTVIATDATLYICGERYFCATQISTILKRYYVKFGRFIICGRTVYVNEVTSSHEDVTDMISEVVSINSFGRTMLGLYDGRFRRVLRNSDLVICRCPGIVSQRVAIIARKMHKPYYTESMGCAWDAYWNHSLAGKAIAPYMFLKMKQVVYHADYALYVTSEFLQKRYPCKNESIGASNVLIESADESLLEERIKKIKITDHSHLTLMTTAALDVRYKGQEFVIKAIPKLNRQGIRVRYLLVGGGDPAYLKSLVRKCGVEDQVEFVGRRPLTEVFGLLDQADIYLQPSLQEGLPRSVIEAMSRACPVIGARTAGIPELISPECVVKRKSSKEIAKTIVEIADSKKMTELATQNFDKAKEFQDYVLSERRNNYYSKIKFDILVGENNVGRE